MRKLSCSSLVAIAVSSILFLGGCTVIGAHKAGKEINENDKLISDKMRQAKTMTDSSTSVSVVDSLYVTGKSFKLTERDSLPEMFDRVITMNKLDPMSFPEIVSHLAFDLGIKIVLSSDATAYLNGGMTGSAEPSQKVSDDSSGLTDFESIMSYGSSGFPGESLKFSMSGYRGTVSGLLDSVVSKGNLFWKWDGTHVTISRLETTNYIFDGDSTEEGFESTINSGRSLAGDSQGGGTSEDSKTSQVTKIKRRSSDSYADLEKALGSMISSEGKFSISTQQGIVTVTDTPVVQSKIANYIEQINSVLNKKITVRTEVYELASDDNGNFGVDLDAIYSGSNRFGVNLLNSSSGDVSPNIELGVISGSNNFNGSKAFINSLVKVADLSLVTSLVNYTTNGRSVPVQVADEDAFVKNITKSESEQGNTSFSTETSSILSGYTMTLTPRINSGGNVDLMFAIDMSQLKKFETIKFGDESMVQLPSRSFKNFEQRVSVGSGSTVMIAGFDRTETRSTTDSIYGKGLWFAGGSRGGGKKMVKTIILITPYIMAK